MSNLTILYIEDDDSQRHIFISNAESRGYEVVAASSGKEGLEKFDKDKFDIVLCDLNMPIMSGIDVLNRVKKISPNTPFLVITAHGSISLAVRAIRQGAYDFVLKPVDFDLIENTMFKAVESRMLQRDPGFTTKGVGVGTGLGLSICYTIIQDHGGEIMVESEIDKGTTFTLVLPIKNY